MNEEIKPPTTQDAITAEDKGRCAPAPCCAAATAKEALELCELWLRHDAMSEVDETRRKNLHHRLHIVREGIIDLKNRQQHNEKLSHTAPTTT